MKTIFAREELRLTILPEQPVPWIVRDPADPRYPPADADPTADDLPTEQAAEEPEGVPYNGMWFVVSG